MNAASKEAALEKYDRQVFSQLDAQEQLTLDTKRVNLFELYTKLGIDVQAELRNIVVKTFNYFIANPMIGEFLLPEVKYRIIGGNACNLLIGGIPSPDIDVEVAPIIYRGAPIPFFSAPETIDTNYAQYSEFLFALLRDAIIASKLLQSIIVDDDITPLTSEDIAADLELGYATKTLMKDDMNNKIHMALIINDKFVSKIQVVIKYKGFVYHIIEILLDKAPKLKADFVPEMPDFSSSTQLVMLPSGDGVYIARPEILALQQMEALVGKKGRIIKKIEAEFQYMLNPSKEIIRTLWEPTVKELDTKVAITFMRIYNLGKGLPPKTIRDIAKIICEKCITALTIHSEKNPRKTIFQWMLPGLIQMSRGETELTKALSEAVGEPLKLEEAPQPGFAARREQEEPPVNHARLEQEAANAALALQLAQEEAGPPPPIATEAPLKILTKEEKRKQKEQKEWEEAELLTAAARQAQAAAEVQAAQAAAQAAAAATVPVAHQQVEAPKPPKVKKKPVLKKPVLDENWNALLAVEAPLPAPTSSAVTLPTLVYPAIRDPLSPAEIKGLRDAEKALVIPPLTVLVEPFAFKAPLIEDFELPFKRDPAAKDPPLRSRHTLQTIIDFLDLRTTDPNYIFIYTMPSFQSRYQLTKAGLEGTPRYMKEEDEIYFISIIIDKLRYIIYNDKLVNHMKKPVEIKEVARIEQLLKSFTGVLLTQLPKYSMLTEAQAAEVGGAVTASAPFLSQFLTSPETELEANADLFITFYRNLFVRIIEFLTFNLLQKNELLFEPEAQYYNAIRKDSLLKHMEKEWAKSAQLETQLNELKREAEKLEQAVKTKADAVYKLGKRASLADKKGAEDALKQYQEKGLEIEKKAESNTDKHAVLVEFWMAFYGVRVRVLKKKLNTLLEAFPEETRPKNIYFYFTRYPVNSSYKSSNDTAATYRNQFLRKCYKMKIQINFLIDLKESRIDAIKRDLLSEDFEEFEKMFQGIAETATTDKQNMFALNFNMCTIHDFCTQYFTSKPYYSDPIFKHALSKTILSIIRAARFHPHYLNNNYKFLPGFECIINDYEKGKPNILEQICEFIHMYYTSAMLSITTEEEKQQSLVGEKGLITQFNWAVLEYVRRSENHANATSNIYADMLILSDKLVWDPLIPYSLKGKPILATNPFYGILTINTQGDPDSDYIVNPEAIIPVPEKAVPAGGGRPHRKTRRRRFHRKTRRGRRVGLKTRRGI